MPRQARSSSSKKVTQTENATPRKRSRTGKATASDGTGVQRFRGRGKLKMLPEMPLDIIFEIFSLLGPSDVLRLSRTTKDLRHLLMSRSAISIWRSAFLNDPDLPAVPDGMNEPQYANLAFSPHCHKCHASGEHSILWAFHVRLCRTCLSGRFDEGHKVLKKLPGNLLSQRTYLLRQGIARLPTAHRIVYSYDEAKEINEQLINLGKGDAKHLEEFIAERKKVVLEIQIHASKSEISGPLRLARMERELQEAQDRRKEEICRRLRELGYEEEVKYLNDTHPRTLSEHALIKSSRELNDRTWANMKPQLLELMQDARERIRRKQRKSLLKKRQRLLLSVFKEFIHERPIDEVNPRAVDVCIMPDIKTMIEDASLDSHTTEDSFKDILTELPRLLEEWRESKTRGLLALLPRPIDRDCLLRATTYFRCSESHSCLSELQHGYRNREDDLALLFMNLDSEPWNYGGNRVSYYPAAEMSARSVVRGCGLDTDLTTAQDMDDVNPWLECLCCRHPVKGRSVFRWRKAVGFILPFLHSSFDTPQILHDMYHATSAELSTWKLLNSEDSDAAEVLQQRTYETDRSSDAPDYVCLQCRERFDFLMMWVHLRTRSVLLVGLCHRTESLDSHGIQDPVQDDDYVLHVDASMDQPPFPLLLPHAAPKVIELADDDDDDDDDDGELEYIGSRSCIVIDDL
ncbi:hypothetical protein B0H10DRAFT_2006326 [Mycena sp. CBHHK59/15]|nr:hypothetical protein B0H10DRAFT_2006326 [Mycena sp. CBHHK59/15]